MPKRLKLRRNFPYSEFDAWFNSDSKLSFDSFINIHACNAALDMQNTNKILSEGSSNKYSSSKTGNTCEKVEKSVNGMSTTIPNANLNYASKTACILHKLCKKQDEARKSLLINAASSSQKEIQSGDSYALEKRKSPNGNDLKLDVHEVSAEKGSLHGTLAESEESISQDVSLVTISFDPKLYDDKNSNLNLACAIKKEVFEEPFNATASRIDKILSEANSNKFSNLKTSKNMAQKSIERMPSKSAANLDYENKTENDCHTALLINAASCSQKEIQSGVFYVLEKNESPDGKDLKLDVLEVGTEKVSLQGTFAKSEKSILQDVSPVTSSFDPQMCDDLNTTCAIKKEVSEEPLNVTPSRVDKILSEANNNKYKSAANLDCESEPVDEAHKALLINAALSSPNEIQSVDFYVLEEIESPNEKDLKLDVHEISEEQVSLQGTLVRSEEPVLQDVSPVTISFDQQMCDLNTTCAIKKELFEEPFNDTPSGVDKILSEANNNKYISTANLDGKSEPVDEAHKASLINAALSSQNVIQSVDFYVLEEIESPDGKDLKLDVHEASEEQVSLQGTLAKSEESVLQDVSPVTSSFDQQMCDLNTTCSSKKELFEEPFNDTPSRVDKILSESNSNKYISTANLDGKSESVDEAHKASLINAALSSQNVIQSVDFYILEEIESPDGKDLKLDVHETSEEQVSLQGTLAKSEESVLQDLSPVTSSFDPQMCGDKNLNWNTTCAIKKEVFEEQFNDTPSTVDKILSEANSNKYKSTANLDGESEPVDEAHKASLINAALSSQNVIQSVDFYILEEIELPGKKDSKLDVQEVSAEKVSLQGILTKSGETSAKAEIFPETNDDKSLISNTGNMCENQVSATISKFSFASDTNAKTQTALPINASSSSQNKFQPFDFYELEKSDIEDPEWENVKKLKSNEERYKQVRECWDSKNIPNPNKNLTYHSYRKLKLKAGKLDDRQIKQHKRQASKKSAHPPAKKTRYCTYTVDNQIQSIKTEQFSKTAIMQNEMKKRVNMLDYNFNHQVSELKKHYNYHQFDYQNSRNQFMRDRNLLGMQYDQNLYEIKSKYHNKMDAYNAQCESKIKTLLKAHAEILTFCNFYVGLGEDDPTVLTEVQLQEIEEIDDVYKQLNKYYK